MLTEMMDVYILYSRQSRIYRGHAAKIFKNFGYDKNNLLVNKSCYVN